MNDHLDHEDSSNVRGDRELTLGTGTILGIFFGLVVLCGACFGGGYFMGHKSQPTPLTIADASPDAITGISTAKPSAGSPFDPSNPSDSNGGSAVTVAPAHASPAPASVVPKPAPVVRRPPPPLTPVDTDDSPASRAADPLKAPAVRPVVPSALLPSAAPAASPGFIMVQVAAVSHQEDADLLLGALRARGYAVMARKGSGDPLIHVQVGPFSTKPAAEAMRQKLMGDGYNAMLKF